MIRLFSLLTLFILFIMMTACAPIYETQYSYIPPHSGMGNMCISQCIQAKTMCEQMCQIRNENCRSEAKRDAYYQYSEYKHERHSEGKKAKKSMSYFDNSYTCNQSCNCAPSFNACYSACGGQVLEKKVCTAFCDKA